MENLELLAERADGNRFVEFVKNPKVWATAIIIIVLVTLVGTYKHWKPVFSSSGKNVKVVDLGDVNAELAESYQNSSLGLSFTYPTGWTVPIESVKNGVMLLQSPDKKLALEFVKGICYKTANVLCMNGYQVTMRMPKADASADSDTALLQSIVDTIKFGN